MFLLPPRCGASLTMSLPLCFSFARTRLCGKASHNESQCSTVSTSSSSSSLQKLSMLLFVLCDFVSTGTALSSFSFLFSGITDNDTNFDKSSSSQTILHAIVQKVFALVSFLRCYQRVARVYLVTLNAPCSSDRRNRLSPKYISLIIVSQCGEMCLACAARRLPAPGTGAQWNCRDGSGHVLHHLVPGNHVGHVIVYFHFSQNQDDDKTVDTRLYN